MCVCARACVCVCVCVTLNESEGFARILFDSTPNCRSFPTKKEQHNTPSPREQARGKRTFALAGNRAVQHAVNELLDVLLPTQPFSSAQGRERERERERIMTLLSWRDSSFQNTSGFCRTKNCGNAPSRRKGERHSVRGGERERQRWRGSACVREGEGEGEGRHAPTLIKFSANDAHCTPLSQLHRHPRTPTHRMMTL